VTKIFQKSLAIVLSLVVIVTTSGLNIYTHSCGCCQSFDVSITVFDECCNHAEKQICQLPDDGQTACCEDHAADAETAHECRKDGCCKFGHDFMKISENFDRPAQVTIQYLEQTATVIELNYNDFDLDIEIENDVVLNISLPPPPLAGKAFVVFTHSFKIAPAFSISA